MALIRVNGGGSASIAAEKHTYTGVSSDTNTTVTFDRSYATKPNIFIVIDNLRDGSGGYADMINECSWIQSGSAYTGCTLRRNGNGNVSSAITVYVTESNPFE